MKSIKYIFFLVLVIIIGASMYVATLESNYDIKQTRLMKVPAEVVFKNINNFNKWGNWSPWYELDSTIVASSEVNSGVGASYIWAGKDGNVSIKTISLIPNKEIIQQFDLGSVSTSEIYWNLTELEGETEVTLGMRGENSFGKKIHWLMNGGIEKNMTPLYQRGLELLEQQLIKEMDIHSIDYKGIVYYGGGYYLYQTTSCKNADAPKKMAEMFPKIVNYMATNQIEASGKPFTLNHQIDLINNTVMFSACIPVKERIITEGEVLTGFLEPQKTFKIIFKGNYKFLPASWPNFYKTLTEEGYTAIKKGYSFEIYTMSPNETANPAEWLTEIYIPIEDIVVENNVQL